MTKPICILMLCCLAILPRPATAQSNGASGQNSLSSINNGEVSANATANQPRIEGGEFNAISVTAQGAQSSVSEIVSITPDPQGSARAGGESGGNAVLGTTSTTINNGSVSTTGSFIGSVNFGDRNSMSIGATGAATSYSISNSTPGRSTGE